jgi:LacI family transcriptional regulator
MVLDAMPGLDLRFEGKPSIGGAVSRKTTLQQIADAAGVSLSTVDRVLNRRGGVASDKELMVLDWAGRLHVDRVLYRSHVSMLRVAVIMQSPQNPFYRGLRDAFIDLSAAMAELRMTVFIHYVEVDKVPQMTRKIAEIGASYDALVVICPDDPKLSAALNKIAQKIPIITLATDLPRSGRIAYVGPDNRQAGRCAGELMGRFLGPPGGKILIVLGLYGMVGHSEREAGFRAVLGERFAACTVAATLESREDRDRAGRVVYDFLRRRPLTAGIYNISAGNTAIVAAMRSLRLEKEPVLVTHELTLERRQLLLEGAIDAIIDQNPRLEAHRAFTLLARHFKRIQLDPLVDEPTPFNIYLRENCPAQGT